MEYYKLISEKQSSSKMLSTSSLESLSLDIISYADDTTLLHSDKDVQKLINEVKLNFNVAKIWFCAKAFS